MGHMVTLATLGSLYRGVSCMVIMLGLQVNLLQNNLLANIAIYYELGFVLHESVQICYMNSYNVFFRREIFGFVHTTSQNI
jgi:hypothetical protein